MTKKSIAKMIAFVAEKMANKACGTASHYGTYQFREPAKLSKNSKWCGRYGMSDSFRIFFAWNQNLQDKVKLTWSIDILWYIL